MKKLEAYLYSQVIMPLKEIGNEGYPVKRGNYPFITVSKEERSYRHNYQRIAGEAKAKRWVLLRGDEPDEYDILTVSHRIASYQPKTHRVTLYDYLKGREEKDILNSLEQMFRRSAPFTKIERVKSKPVRE